LMKNGLKSKNFLKVLCGKIDFIKNVKGEKNPIYRKLINKYNSLENNNKDELPINIYEEIKDSIFIIKSGGRQGTGFLIKDLGIATCEHTIFNNKDIVYFKCNKILDKTNATIVKKDKEKDIAILDYKFKNGDIYFEINRKSFNYGEEVTIAGFPAYRIGDQPRIIPAKIAGKRQDKYGNTRFIVDMGLYAGESGGIVLNKKNEISGMVVTGVENEAHHYETAEFGIIPISELFKI